MDEVMSSLGKEDARPITSTPEQGSWLEVAPSAEACTRGSTTRERTAMSSEHFQQTSPPARSKSQVGNGQSDVRTQVGRCPTHGTVVATKVLPKIRFPFIYFGALRAVANAKAFRCPECSAKVTAS